MLRYLHEEGETEKQALITAVTATRVEGKVSDHDRVRTAVQLEVDVLPRLEELELINRKADELSLAFFSVPVYTALGSITGSRASNALR